MWNILVTGFRGRTVLENKIQDIVKEVGARVAVLGKGLYISLVSTKTEWTREQPKLLIADC